jgi:hypothetical protein
MHLASRSVLSIPSHLRITCSFPASTSIAYQSSRYSTVLIYQQEGNAVAGSILAAFLYMI